MIIKVEKLEDALNKFNNEKLSPELNEYIKKECQANLKNTLEINIEGKLTKKEQEKFANTIHSYYESLFKKYRYIDKYDNTIRVILLFIGIILLLISEQTTSLISELFLITGWIFIWEMLYDGLFNQINRKRKANIYKKLATSKINFKQ